MASCWEEWEECDEALRLKRICGESRLIIIALYTEILLICAHNNRVHQYVSTVV